jgi:hypothetical protein
MNFFKKSIYFFIFLTSYCIHAQTVKVIDNKGTLKEVDNSKWSTSGSNISNKNSGNVGIGTASPANTLEIKQGTAGNSGLRFSNLNSSSAASTSASKVLGLNSTGDVILTNIPGTQNIVDFSTVTPTTSGVVFTPNTPADESVVYQSAVDNSLWTYNGTTYVTYTVPASTAWFTSGTTNDAGNSKTSNIYRTGRLGIGTNNPVNNLDVVGGFNLRNVVGAGGTNYGMEFNTNGNSPRIDWVYNGNYTGSFAGDADFFFRLQNSRLGSGGFRFMTNPNGTAVERMTILNNGNVGIGSTTPLTKLVVNDNAYIASLPVSSANLMDNTTFRPLTRFQTSSGANNNAISHYLTTTAAATQAHNYSTGVSLPYVLQPGGGNVGIGATAPAARLHIQGIQATLGANASATMLRMSRPTWAGQKWGSVAQFNLGTYVDSGNNVDSKSRLDLALANGNDDTTLTPTPTMTWLANGNVGINNTAPSAPLVVQGVTGTGSLKLIAPSVASGDNWWLGFGHGTTSTDANDRARIGSEIVSGGAGRLFFTTGLPGGQTRAMFIDESQRVGIGTSSPASKLEVSTGVTTTNSIVNATGSIDDFLQYNIKNTSTGTKAQSGFNAMADNGNDTTGFVWMGINNSNFNFPTTYNIGGPNDVAFIGSGQDMYVANASNTKSIIFSTGKATTPFFGEQMRILNNGNVGVGTATPLNKLVVKGLNNPVSALGTAQTNAIFRVEGETNHALDMGTLTASPYGAYVQSHNKGGATTLPLALNPVGGNVGIGTLNPTSTLEVNGSATNTVAYNAGAATAILFNNSNLAYTSASPTAFFLQGIKNGGTYTLAVQGTTSGTANFSAVGFTFKSVNNGTTIAGKDTLYTFVVMGTTVYVYMATGFN